MHVTVIDPRCDRRQAKVRSLMAAGHHAEPCEDPTECVDFVAHSDLVLVLDHDDHVSDVLLEMSSRSAPGALVVMGDGRGRAASFLGSTACYVRDDDNAARLVEGLSLPDIRRPMAMTWTTRECGISLDRLSPRELEVAEHMVRGRDTREISQALGISPRTVEIHRSSVIAKMGAANSNHACAMIAVARPDILTRPKP